MHRLIQWWYRRQHAPANATALRDAALRAAVIDMHRRAEQMWNATEPTTPPIRRLPRTAQRILADTSVVFTADNLPLPDDPYTADVDWILTVYNLLTARRDALPTAQRIKLHRAVQTPRGARLTLTIFFPTHGGTMQLQESASLIQALRNEVQSVLGPTILWGDVDAQCVPSDDPAWAVSIAAVDAPMEGVA